MTAAIIGAIILGVADMALRVRSWRQVSLGVALYALCAWPAAVAFRSGSYRMIFNVWACAAVVFTVLVSVFFYHEPMTLRKWVASALVLAAMLAEG